MPPLRPPQHRLLAFCLPVYDGEMEVGKKKDPRTVSGCILGFSEGLAWDRWTRKPMTQEVPGACLAEVGGCVRWSPIDLGKAVAACVAVTNELFGCNLTVWGNALIG